MDDSSEARKDELATSAEVLRVTWIGFWVNLVLSAFKIAAGFFGNSRAVIADGVHSLSDLITDVAIIIGVRYWMAPPDAQHAYGHKRLESLISLSIGVVLALAGVGIAIDAVKRIGHQEGEQVGSLLALFAAASSALCKEILYRWTIKKARELKSDALEANAWDHRSDALSSLPIAVAVAVTLWFPALAFVDLIGAILVALFILHAAWKICKGAVYVLIDGGGDLVVYEKIRTYALAVDGVRDVHKLRTRFEGQGLFVDMHVCVDGSITVAEGSVIAHHVVDALHSQEAVEDIGVDILEVLVHIDPSQESL